VFGDMIFRNKLSPNCTLENKWCGFNLSENHMFPYSLHKHPIY